LRRGRSGCPKSTPSDLICPAVVQDKNLVTPGYESLAYEIAVHKPIP